MLNNFWVGYVYFSEICKIMICRIPWVIVCLTQQCDSTNSNYFTWDLTVWCWMPFKPHLHYLYLLLFFNHSSIVFCFFFCCLFCYFVLFYCFVTCFMIQMKYKSWQFFLVVAPTSLRTKHLIWWCNFTILFLNDFHCFDVFRVYHHRQLHPRWLQKD